MAAFVQLQRGQVSLVIDAGPAALAGTAAGPAFKLALSYHWQACYPAIHPSMRSYEALARYAECEDAKCGQYKNMLSMIKIVKYAEYAEYE